MAFLFFILSVDCPALIRLLWNLINITYVTSAKEFWETCEEPMNAKEILLRWLNSKRIGHEIKNFTTDWNDGTALCQLIDSIKPGLLPEEQYLQGSLPLSNVQIAMEKAKSALGIPMIISPSDMICSEVDELSVMTYLALIFEYDLECNSAKRSSHAKNRNVERGEREHVERDDNEETIRSSNTEKASETVFGVTGEEIEYRLNLHDVNADEITVSIEFKPSGKMTESFKPNLKVFSMGKGRFRVNYTPNYAGKYRVSMYYKDEHIADSPYCLLVLPSDNTKTDLLNNSSQLNDLCDRETSHDIPGFYGMDGEGLRQATVGKLAVFTVITDNRDKGPLSVCINCPAVSLPVPHVKSTRSKNYSTHTVAYMPTLAGTYTIYVRWGLKLINGRPFQVCVNDFEPPKMPAIRDKKKSKRRSTQFSHIKVYYSSTSLDPNVINATKELENVLGRYGVSRNAEDGVWVSIDVELQKDERELIFHLAGTRTLPLVFIHEDCLGSFKEVKQLDEMNELEEKLMFKIRKV